MSDVLSLMKKRYSVRAFNGQAVSEQDLSYICEAGRWAATSNNKQARHFVLITDPELRRRLVSECKMQPFVADAGVVVVGIATNAESGGSTADVFISMTQMELAAVERGLGTIWLGIYDREAVASMIGLPAGQRIVSLMAIGHAAAEGAPREKKPISELYSINRYQASSPRP